MKELGKFKNGATIEFEEAQQLSSMKWDEMKQYFPNFAITNTYYVDIECRVCHRSFTATVSGSTLYLYLIWLFREGYMCKDCREKWSMLESYNGLRPNYENWSEEEKDEEVDDLDSFIPHYKEYPFTSIALDNVKKNTDEYIGMFFIPHYTPLCYKDLDLDSLLQEIERYRNNKGGIYTKHFNDYIKTLKTDDYLSTLYWRVVSQYNKMIRGEKCELCGRRTSEIAIHHKTWRNKGWELMYPEDLYCCCNNCFKKIYSK